jgi:hypothetical protein
MAIRLQIHGNGCPAAMISSRVRRHAGGSGSRYLPRSRDETGPFLAAGRPTAALYACALRSVAVGGAGARVTAPMAVAEIPAGVGVVVVELHRLTLQEDLPATHTQPTDGLADRRRPHPPMHRPIAIVVPARRASFRRAAPVIVSRHDRLAGMVRRASGRPRGP